MSRINVDQIYTRTGTGTPALREMPAFRVYLDSSQSVTAGVFTRVDLNNKTGNGSFDTNDWFDVTTNHRYIPQIAGYYQFNGLVRCSGTNQNAQGAQLWKNGATIAVGDLNRVETSAGMNVSVSGLIYLNGSTDYVELAGYANGTGSSFAGTGTVNNSTFLSGFLVRPD